MMCIGNGTFELGHGTAKSNEWRRDKAQVLMQFYEYRQFRI
jgi:hypothetical protein